MNVSTWTLHELVPTLPVVVLLVALGLAGWHVLQLQDSEMDLQTIQILATLEGDAPSQLELAVAHQIEDELASLRRMDRIATTIDDGLVTIRVSFGIDRNADEVFHEVRNAVDRVCVDLLSGVASSTTSKLATAGSMVLAYTVAPLRKAPGRSAAAGLPHGGQSWAVRRPVACA